ncbi:MAG: hypothetical protein R3D67_19395 [Hyphomicrobiaceae bacterium]
MRKPKAEPNAFRIVTDLSHAEQEAHRIENMLLALRKRHDLARFEFTRLVRIRPAGATHSHPILTLSTRFAATEDMLLSTYLHEQMHWYLWELGGHDHDPIEPFFDELVRRYPKAPTSLPDGGRNYEQTYLHIVVCWLEIWASAQLIGMQRARAVADAPWGYRWIYRTVLEDWHPLGDLLTENALLPMPRPEELARQQQRQPATNPAADDRAASTARPGRAAPGRKASVAARKKTPAAPPPPSRRNRRRPPARGGTSAG